VYDGEGPVFQYIALCWKRNERRLSLNEVLELELKRHYLLEYGGFLEIYMEMRRRYGVLTANMEQRAKQFALSTMELSHV
jgi:hypothetical protein